MKVLVTGASGFVGRAVCASLASLQHEVIAQFRTPQTLSNKEQTNQYSRGLIADLTDIPTLQTSWASSQTIVHCAARVHQVRESAAGPLAEYRRVNTQAT